MTLSALCLPNFVIPRGLSTLYRCSLTTMAKDTLFSEILLIRYCCNHNPGQSIFNHRSFPSFVRVKGHGCHSLRKWTYGTRTDGIQNVLCGCCHEAVPYVTYLSTLRTREGKNKKRKETVIKISLVKPRGCLDLGWLKKGAEHQALF